MSQDQSSTYTRAENLTAAWQLLRDGASGAKPAWISPRPQEPIIEQPATWVDLSNLQLDELKHTDQWLSIGAGVTLTRLQAWDLSSSSFGGVIAHAARKTAHHGLRNLATLGAVIQEPSAAPELGTALLATDSQLEYFDGSEKSIKLAQAWQVPAFKGLPTGIKLDLELATVTLGSIQWVGRSPMDQAIVTAASCLKLEAGKITWLRLAVAGDGLKPQRLASIEQQLERKEIIDLDRSDVEQKVRSEINPTSSYRASADYQSHLAGVLAWRAVMMAIGEVK